jgi:hypothetical protein
MSLSDLCEALSKLDPLLGKELAEQLVETLQQIESPDDLFESLMSLEGLLLDSSIVDDESPCLDSSAVLGLFIRKVLIKFHTSLFEGLSNLFNQVQYYVLSEYSPDDVDPADSSSVQTELANFIPHHASIIEAAPPSLQAIPAPARRQPPPARPHNAETLYCKCNISILSSSP